MAKCGFNLNECTGSHQAEADAFFQINYVKEKRLYEKQRHVNITKNSIIDLTPHFVNILAIVLFFQFYSINYEVLYPNFFVDIHFLTTV